LGRTPYPTHTITGMHYVFDSKSVHYNIHSFTVIATNGNVIDWSEIYRNSYLH